jgi:hypothetical protein
MGILTQRALRTQRRKEKHPHVCLLSDVGDEILKKPKTGLQNGRWKQREAESGDSWIRRGKLL